MHLTGRSEGRALPTKSTLVYSPVGAERRSPACVRRRVGSPFAMDRV